MACIIPATSPSPFVEGMSVPEKKGDEFRRFLFSYSQDLESLRIIFPKLTVSQRYYAAEIFYLNYNWESLLLALDFINELQLLPYQLENLFSRIIDQEDLSRRFVVHFSAEQRDRFLYFAFNTGKIENIATVLECIPDIPRSKFLYCVSCAVFKGRSDVMHYCFTLPHAPTIEETNRLLCDTLQSKSLEDFRFLIARGADPNFAFTSPSMYYRIFADDNPSFLNEFVVAGTNLDIEGVKAYRFCFVYDMKRCAAALFNLGYAGDMRCFAGILRPKERVVTFLYKVNEEVNKGDLLRGEEATDRFIRYYLTQCPSQYNFSKTLFETLESEERTLTEGAWELYRKMQHQFIELPLFPTPEMENDVRDLLL